MAITVVEELFDIFPITACFGNDSVAQEQAFQYRPAQRTAVSVSQISQAMTCTHSSHPQGVFVCNSSSCFFAKPDSVSACRFCSRFSIDLSRRLGTSMERSRAYTYLVWFSIVFESLVSDVAWQKRSSNTVRRI